MTRSGSVVVHGNRMTNLKLRLLVHEQFVTWSDEKPRVDAGGKARITSGNEAPRTKHQEPGTPFSPRQLDEQVVVASCEPEQNIEIGVVAEKADVTVGE